MRTQVGHDWPAFPRSRVAEVLTPTGVECQPVEGWGDLRLRCGDAYVAFSSEDVGWQVAVDGDLENPEVFIARVTEQVAEAAGEPCEWLRIG
jgi:hypothetical protein